MENVLEIIRSFWGNLQQGQLLEMGQWNYVLLGLLVAIEGPLATLFGAAAASAGMMRLWAVFLAAACGNTAADLLWYLLGRSGNPRVINRISRLAWMKQSALDGITKAMEKHAAKILFFAKLTSGFMIPALISAGLTRVPIRRWLPILLIGETIWTGSLVIIGYYTTQSLAYLSEKIGILIFAASIVFLMVLIWLGRRVIVHSSRFNRAMLGEDGQNQ